MDAIGSLNLLAAPSGHKGSDWTPGTVRTHSCSSMLVRGTRGRPPEDGFSLEETVTEFQGLEQNYTGEKLLVFKNQAPIILNYHYTGEKITNITWF